MCSARVHDQSPRIPLITAGVEAKASIPAQVYDWAAQPFTWSSSARLSCPRARSARGGPDHAAQVLGDAPARGLSRESVYYAGLARRAWRSPRSASHPASVPAAVRPLALPSADGAAGLCHHPGPRRDAMSAFVAGTSGSVRSSGGRPGRRYVVMAGPRQAFLLRGGERHWPPARVRGSPASSQRELSRGQRGERHASSGAAQAAAFSARPLAVLPRLARGGGARARSWEPGRRVRSWRDARDRGEQLGIVLAIARWAIATLTPSPFSASPSAPAWQLSRDPAPCALVHRGPPPDVRLPPGPSPPTAPRRGGWKGGRLIDLLLAAGRRRGPLSEQDVIANAQIAYSNILLYTAPAWRACLCAGQAPEVMREATGGGGRELRPRPPSRPQAHEPLAGAARVDEALPIALTTPAVAAEPFEFEGTAWTRRLPADRDDGCHSSGVLPDPIASTCAVQRAAERALPSRAFAPRLGSPLPRRGPGRDPDDGDAAALLRNLAFELDPRLQPAPGRNPFPDPEEGFASSSARRHPRRRSPCSPAPRATRSPRRCPR